MTARTEPTSAVSSSLTRISCSVPATGDGISVSTLSVETSSSGSSTSTVSPMALEPAGDGAFGDALAQGRQRDFVAFAGRRRLRRCLGGGRFLQPVPRLREPLQRRAAAAAAAGASSAGAAAAEPRPAAGAVADAHQRGANFGGLVFGDEDFLDHAGDRRGDFGVYFVGGNLEQRLVHLYPVTYLLEPAGDGSFGDALTEGGQVNGFRHVVPVLLIDL